MQIKLRIKNTGATSVKIRTKMQIKLRMKMLTQRA